MLDLVLFYFFAILAIGSAILVVTRRNAVQSAIFLVTSLLATAGIFLTLHAEFLFIVQIILYAGGIMVLFVFVIMLLNAGLEEHTSISKLAGFPGILLALALTGFIGATVARSAGLTQVTSGNGNIPGALSSTRALSTMIFKNFAYPFELTSFLILIAILGAIVLAHREN